LCGPIGSGELFYLFKTQSVGYRLRSKSDSETSKTDFVNMQEVHPTASEDSVRTTLGVQKFDSSFVCTGSKTTSDMNELSLSGNSVNIYQHFEASFPHQHGHDALSSGGLFML